MKKDNKKQKVFLGKTGIAHIHSSFNNTIITITDPKGNTLMWASGGSIGYKGSRRSTSYAAQIVGQQLGAKARDLGIFKLAIIIKGIGEGRNTAPKGLQKAGLKITSIQDVTPMPHNGCRPSKRRRV